MSGKRALDLDTALDLFGRSYYLFARATEVLEPALIRQLLHALVKKRPRDPGVLFLQTAFDETAPRESWRTAVNALKVFGAFYTWGSKPKRDKLTAVASNPRLLAATQTAAVGSSEVPDEYLAVLAVDASETSIDALLPHFAAAMKDPTRLDGLAKLGVFAKSTPALTALLAQVEERLRERHAASPSMLLARQLDLVTGPRFRVRVGCEATPSGKGSLDVLLDSSSADDYRVWLFRDGPGRITFSAHAMKVDDLGLGRCALPDLPQWLSRAEKTLGVRWDPARMVGRYLRGQRLATFVGWLLSGSDREG